MFPTTLAAPSASLAMNLLLVTGSFPERSETFIYRKSVGLARRGHRVTLAVRRIGDWSLYRDPLPSNLTVELMPPDDELRRPQRALRLVTSAARAVGTSARRTRQLLAMARDSGRPGRQFVRHLGFVDAKADVVHFEFLSLAAMYPLVRDFVGAPIVVSCRGQDVHTLELRTEVERERGIQCLRDADAIHCVSAEMATEVTRLTGRTTGLWVNRPAVDVDAITPTPRQGTRAPHIIATGRLVWKKGFDYLLAALAMLARKGVAFTAEIIGDGELRHFLRYSIGDLGLADRVTLSGALTAPEVLARMRAADVFVLSSLEEGISNAVLEAMASGMPVVTTDAGGMREAISDGVEGYVVSVRDRDALAAKLEVLLADPARRAAMGQAARARAVADFSLARQLDTFEALYRSIGAGS